MDRYRSRFFVRVGYQTTYVLCMYLSSRNHYFSLYHVIVSPTNFINNLLKDWKILIFKVKFDKWNHTRGSRLVQFFVFFFANQAF